MASNKKNNKLKKKKAAQADKKTNKKVAKHAAKIAKKTTKKTLKNTKKSSAKGKRKTASKNKTKTGHKFSIWKWLFKWCFVVGLWSFILLSVLTAWYGSELPDIIQSPHFERSVSTQILDRNGDVLASYGHLKGNTISVENVPHHVIHAVTSIEDRRFYKHSGVDPVGIARAMATNIVHGRVRQGGSTITQQLAKNLFLSHERTIKRKIQEALLAVWLEREFTKDEILSTYLNRVYFGSGAYGIDAAAQTYFDKHASALTVYEGAMIAGLLKAPSRYSPHNNPELAKKRAQVVLQAMRDNSNMPLYALSDVSETQTKPADTPVPPVPLTKAYNINARYVTDMAIARKQDLVGTQQNDLQVHTTLHLDLLNKIDDIVRKSLSRYRDRHVTQAAVIVMTPSGEILALTGGVNYRDSQFNRASQAIRSPGSAFKPIVFLTALENGWKADSLILDAPLDHTDYNPQNFNDEYLGDVTLDLALQKSLNTATVRLAQAVGTKNIIKTAQTLGIKSPQQNNLSLALVSNGLSLMELTAAYAVIANGGHKVKPYIMENIQSDTHTHYAREDKKSNSRVIKRSTARGMKDMLRNVVLVGTGKNARLPFDSYGKTGTSQYYRDAWFVGFSDEYAVGVWAGNDDNSPMQSVTGGSLPAEIFHDVMLATHKMNIHQAPDDKSEDKGDSSFQNFIQNILNE